MLLHVCAWDCPGLRERQARGGRDTVLLEPMQTRREESHEQTIEPSFMGSERCSEQSDHMPRSHVVFHLILGLTQKAAYKCLW